MSSNSWELGLVHTYQGCRYPDRLPVPLSVLACLSAEASAHAKNPYLTVISRTGEATLMYVELEILSSRLAAWLRDELRVQARDVVGLIPTADLVSVVSIFALLKSHCAILFLNPNDPPDRMRQQIQALNVTTIIRSGGTPANCLPESILLPDISILNQDSFADAPLSDPDPDMDALIFGTSGSTAVAKLVVQSNYNAAVNAYSIARHHGLQRRDRFLGCLPLHHVNGVHFSLFATLAAGAHAVIMDVFDAGVYLRLIERFRPRVASVVPSILELLLDRGEYRDLSCEMGYFVSAAAPLSVHTAGRMWERMQVRVLQGYGLTETTNFSTTVPINTSPETYRRLLLDVDIPSIGAAVYGNEVAVLRDDGTRAASGEVGELCMRGHNVMLGYAGNPDATAVAFRNGWFHSEDLGFQVDDESGRGFFMITGRTKNIAKVAGEGVSLDEMERVLRALPHVQDAACAFLPDRFLGDSIIAAVVLSRDMNDADIRLHLGNTFAAAVLPRRIVRMSSIPRTPTGKIRRGEIAEHLSSHGHHQD